MPREYEIKEKALKCLATLQSQTIDSIEEYKKFIIDDNYMIENFEANLNKIAMVMKETCKEFSSLLQDVATYKLENQLKSVVDELFDEIRKSKGNA